MSVVDEDRDDDDIPELFTKALTAASERAVQAGHTIVVVKDGQLVEMSPAGIIVLKSVPPRHQISKPREKMTP